MDRGWLASMVWWIFDQHITRPLSFGLLLLAAFWLKRMRRQIDAYNLSFKRSHPAVRAKGDSGKQPGSKVAHLFQRQNQFFASHVLACPRQGFHQNLGGAIG